MPWTSFSGRCRLAGVVQVSSVAWAVEPAADQPWHPSHQFCRCHPPSAGPLACDDGESTLAALYTKAAQRVLGWQFGQLFSG